MTTNLSSEPNINALLQELDEDLLIRVKETFLVHSIIGMVKEKTLPADHPDQEQLGEIIKRCVRKRAEQKGKKITRKHLEKITDDLLEYHKRACSIIFVLSQKCF